MDERIDPGLQRIIANATASSTNEYDSMEQSLGIFSNEARPDRWAYGYGSSQQNPAYFTEFEQAPFTPQPSSMLQSGPALSRISFPPWNISRQSDRGLKTIQKADNHFRFAQNLRQGLSINPPLPPPKSMNAQSLDQIDQLANAMLLQRSMSSLKPEPEPTNFLQSLHSNRLDVLQPRRQQVTPPFNMSGFAFSPMAGLKSDSSSPLARQGSSPTTRLSLRRAIRPAHSSRDPEIETKVLLNSSFLVTPQRTTSSAARGTPQTLSLDHKPPMAHGIQLVSPHELPDRSRQVFPYELFNAVQSKCFAPIYRTNDNIVVAAPTGSGKTALLELAICKLVEGHGSEQFKIIYLAPTKSLCAERMQDWQRKFSHLNLQCAELTGDTNQREMSRVRNASIIVTTPEKWDSITRHWSDHHKLVQMVKLFLIDEVHILKDIRGATLEAVVSRMKTMSAEVRILALSATVPNSHDIAVWLGKDHANPHLPAHQETFSEDFRPVKLQKFVHGFDGSLNDYAFEKTLDRKLPSLIGKYTHKKPIMVFCFTRKSCEVTASKLAEWWTGQKDADRAWPVPHGRVLIGNKELRELVTCGVAFHHAGLDQEDRHAVESGFLKGDISVICCTSTLAVGVNLPCHLVVLKGTVSFQQGRPGEYSDLEVMQMLGRAGRPQFDDNAVAIIMTRTDKVDRYKKMISGQDILESTLHLNLIEHLNSEISLGSIKDLYSAKVWIKSTFLYVRMQRNPKYYQIEGISCGGDPEKRLEMVCERDIKLLQESKLVTDEQRICCTEYGEAMSRYMVKFDTMQLLLSIAPHAKTEQILNTICKAAEFKDLRMKPNERPFLRELNKSPFTKYPIKEHISTTAHKISLMIQIQLGGIDLSAEKDFNTFRWRYTTEKGLIFERIQRLIRCVIDCKLADCDAISTRHGLDLARSLSAEYWENSNLQLRQIPQVGAVAAKKLVANNISTVELLASKDTATIERCMSKNPPFGKKMKDMLRRFPFLTIVSEIVGKPQFQPGVKPKVNVKAVIGYDNIEIPIWKDKKPAVTFMAENSDGTLVHFWCGNIMNLAKKFELKFAAELSRPNEEIKCWIACQDIVGTVRSCVLTPDIPTSAFPAEPPPEKTKPLDQITIQRSLVDDSDEFGADELNDDDMLAAAKVIELTETDDYGSDEFVDIDDFETTVQITSPKNENKATSFDSVQMANGKWTCNHSCANGGMLKTGQPCKHRCCHEGLDKPRRSRKKIYMGKEEQVKQEADTKDEITRRKDSRASGASSLTVTKAKTGRKPLKVKLQEEENYDLDLEDVEIVNLAEELLPVPYSELAPRAYRKLHSLHASIQKDRGIRQPRQKPQFSYASGQQPELPFLQKNSNIDDMSGDSEDDDFPPASEFLGGHGGCFELGLGQFGFGDIANQSFPNIASQNVSPSSVIGNSTENMEAAVLELGDSIDTIPSSPKVNSSFADRVFDFAAFSDLKGTEEKLANLVTTDTSKRQRSDSLDLPEIKHRRIIDIEPASQPPPPLTTPAWVTEFDPEIINGLKGFVNFID